MTYRRNELEGTMREKDEAAKATLEELAEKEVDFNNERLTDALEVMGFERRELTDYRYPSYVRKGEDITEVLTGYDLGDKKMKNGFHLYQISAEQNVENWYQENNKKLNNELTTILRVIGAGGMFGYIPIGINELIKVLSQQSQSSLTDIVAYIVGIGFVASLYLNNRPFKRQLSRKGQKALRYIAQTPFEETPAYQKLNLRIEEPKEKPGIIDAEFSEVEAEREAEAVEEEVERLKR